MAAKKNKDGFTPGELVGYKAHNQYMIKKRLEEKKRRAEEDAKRIQQ